MFSVLIHLTLNHYRVESAKLRALRAKVPCVLTCQRPLRAYVFKCQRALRAYVRTCQRVLGAYMPCVLTCKRASRAYLTTYLACLSAQMPTCLCTYVRTWLRAKVLRVPCLTFQHSLPD